MAYVLTNPTNAEILEDISGKLKSNYKALKLKSAMLNILDIDTEKGKKVFTGAKWIGGVACVLTVGFPLYAGLAHSIGGGSPEAQRLITFGLQNALWNAGAAAIALGAYGTAHVYKRFFRKEEKENDVVVDKEDGVIVDASSVDSMTSLVRDLIDGQEVEKDRTLTIASKIYNGTDLASNSDEVNIRLIQALAAHRSILVNILRLNDNPEKANAALEKLSKDLREIVSMEGCSSKLRNNETVLSITGLAPTEQIVFEPINNRYK